MTHRERFVKLFRGEPVDRAPFLDFMGGCNFPSCLARWKREGLAGDATWSDVARLVGFDYGRGVFLDAQRFFFPLFEVKFIKKEPGQTFTYNKWGALEVRPDDPDVMPLTLEGPVRDRYSWDAVKERLRGRTEERLPVDLDALIAYAEKTGLPVYCGDLPAGFFGGLREILGFENLMYIFYDDPDLLSEILDTLCDLWIDLYTALQKKVNLKLDYVFIWEDMCGKNGPLIGPELFRRFLLPHYKRLTAALKKNGNPLFMVDSDGDERPLVPLWIEGGVDIAVPWETQFGLDIAQVRRDFPTLGLVGGLDKRALEIDRARMDIELNKVPYLLERGRYIPSLDHGVTGAVSWDNYRYFYDGLRELIFHYH